MEKNLEVIIQFSQEKAGKLKISNSSQAHQRMVGTRQITCPTSGGTKRGLARSKIHPQSLLRTLCCRCLVTKSCPTLFVTPWTVAHHAPQSMGFPSKNTGVDCHFLLQGIFPTQRSKLCLLHWQADSLPLSHQGSLKAGYKICYIRPRGNREGTKHFKNVFFRKMF